MVKCLHLDAGTVLTELPMSIIMIAKFLMGCTFFTTATIRLA